MDVVIPPLAPEDEAWRDEVRAFLGAHRPALEYRQRSGVRTPETAEEVAVLRAWVGVLADAGYMPDRFRLEPLPPARARILEAELSATGLPYVLGNPLVSGALRAVGTPEQKARHLEAIGRGEHIWTQLFSEPDFGSDLSSLQTKAVRDGEDFVVTGQKVWSTWAQWADFGYLLARSEPVEGPAGITAFIVDMHAPGVTTRPLREMTGTADFNEVFLDEVRIPADCVLGAPGQGWGVAQASLAQERGGVADHASDRQVADLLAIARSQTRGDRTLLDDAAVRQRIADVAVRQHLLRCLGYAVATRAARGTTTPLDAPATKILFSETNLALARLALELQGPEGVLVEGDPGSWDDGAWQDAFLYARAWTIAGGSNEVLRNVIAERGLGLPREPRG
jgi:alkylation response protein AidB-like acyl-CoA dehydrogenase